MYFSLWATTGSEMEIARETLASSFAFLREKN